MICLGHYIRISITDKRHPRSPDPLGEDRKLEVLLLWVSCWQLFSGRDERGGERETEGERERRERETEGERERGRKREI